MLVALDGPAGAGKSSLARALQRRRGFRLVGTGSLYRAVAAMALEQGIALEDEPALASLARGLRFALVGEPGEERLEVDGRPEGAWLRGEMVASATSQVSALPEVRAALLATQRRLAREAAHAVLEGRDIGTVVLPDADLKVYVTADVGVRAQRRLAQGEDTQRSLAEIEAAIAERDLRDEGRAVAPLTRAADARLLDTSGLSEEEAIATLLAWVDEVMV